MGIRGKDFEVNLLSNLIVICKDLFLVYNLFEKQVKVLQIEVINKAVIWQDVEVYYYYLYKTKVDEMLVDCNRVVFVYVILINLLVDGSYWGHAKIVSILSNDLVVWLLDNDFEVMIVVS